MPDQPLADHDNSRSASRSGAASGAGAQFDTRGNAQFDTQLGVQRDMRRDVQQSAQLDDQLRVRHDDVQHDEQPLAQAAAPAADLAADLAADRADALASALADVQAGEQAGIDTFLPFALPDIGEEEIRAVETCLRSGWVTTGPTTRRFEKAFRDYLGGDVEAVAVNSATAGLHLALEAAGIAAGDEVIVPTLTFTATAEVVRYLGAHPVFVDIVPDTLNLDTAAAARAVTPRTRAIVPVHYAGLACDMDAIGALARRHGLRVIEDAAHAFPTRSSGRLIGTLDSDAAVFSFYANKTMTTGEGGMVVTRDPALAQRMRCMRLHGISRDAFDRYVSRTPAWYYEVVAAGFKYNLTDIASAIGIEQLRKIDRFQLRRAELAARYDAALAGLPLVLPARPHPASGSTHAWHLYVVRLASGARLERDELISRLAERGIGTSVHFIPLHRQPYWADYLEHERRARTGTAEPASPALFPVAEAAFESMLTLPLYTRMRDSDQERVIAALHDLLS